VWYQGYHRFDYSLHEKLFISNFVDSWMWFEVGMGSEPELDLKFSPWEVRSKVQPIALDQTLVRFKVHQICWRTGLNWTSAAVLLMMLFICQLPFLVHLVMPVRGRCARRRNDIELRLIRPQQSDYIQNEGGCATAIGSTGRSNNITGRGMIPVYLGVTTKYGRKGTGICMYV